MDLKTNNTKYTFLMCSERSGSNFITKLMNNHSQVCVPSTKHIINFLARNYFRYHPFDESSWDTLINDLLTLFHIQFSVWKADFSLEEIKSKVEIGDLKGLIQYFFSKEALLNNKSHVFIKEIKLHEFYPFLKYYFPKANFVYQVRDPRDMALSWKKNETHKGGIIAAAKQWKNDQQNYLKILALENNENNIVSIKYEDLVSDTEKKLKPILNMLNLNFEAGMLEMGKDDLTNKNAKQQKAWENLSKPVMTDNFNKFKIELSQEEIMNIEAICYFEMVELGYEPEYKWNELAKIKVQDLEKFHHCELDSLNYEPTQGILDNMQAKKVFYQQSEDL